MHNEIFPTSNGLLRCLQAIAEEAEALGLTNTRRVLQHAISTCYAETEVPSRPPPVAYVGTVH